MPTEYDQIFSLTLTTSSANIGPTFLIDDCKTLSLEAIFTYGSGGTSAKAYVQTSLDAGATWFDVACLAFATTTASKLASLSSTVAVTTAPAPTDGSLTDNTVRGGGPLGDRIRVKTLVDGTYAGGTTLAIHAVR